MSKKTIYALLIAINDYTDGVRPLNGCLNDMYAFRDYLARQCKSDEFVFNPLVLENGDATRAAVIESFSHFQSATEEDVCVLYFSGHGSRIPTTNFWEAQDGKIEAIVCFDACVADKELSCLIYEAMRGKNGVHFLVVMDCCHSGGNTRFDDGVRIRLSKPNRFPEKIEDYYGFDKNLYIANDEGKYSAPKGRHINFGACRNTQTAKETIIGADFRGAFTSSLIEALDTSHAPLSYIDLERRVGQKIENRVADQRPQLDAVNGVNPQITFLGGAVLPKNRYFVAWNKKANSWELNAGLYHGITFGGSTPSVIKGENPDIFFDIHQIAPDTALGTWRSETFSFDKKAQYVVSVQIGGAQGRLVAFSPDCAGDRKDRLDFFFLKACTSYIHLTDNIDEASFFIHTDNNRIWLRKKGEDPPVFYPTLSVEINLTEAFDFWKKVDNVMLWQHLKNLDNPVTSLTDSDINLTLYRSEGIETWWNVSPNRMERIENWKAETIFNYKNDVPPSFALNIENKSNRTLYFSALFMDGRFGIDNTYLPTCSLQAQQNVWLSLTQGPITTQSMGIGIDDAAFEKGVTEEKDYLKIMASTKIFDSNAFVQESLNITGVQPEPKRGIMRIPQIEQDDWVCFLVPLCLVRI